MKGLLLDKDGDIRIVPHKGKDGLTGFVIGDTLIQNAAIVLELNQGCLLYTSIPGMYEYKGLVMKDVIRNVEFTDNGVDVKQGDKSIATQFTLLPSHIDWKVAMYFNNRLKDF